MATAVSGAVNRVPLSIHGSSSGASAPSTAFFGTSLKKANPVTNHGRMSTGGFRVMAADLDESKQTEKDKWAGLAYDISDDQQDITRGKGMVDSLFQAPMGDGTHVPIMNSYEYISQGLKEYNFDNTMDGFYIAPAFMDKLVVHITKNYMDLPNIKVPLILGVWGGKGQGKSFQCELVFAKMGISPIMMSAGELESGNAGEPAKLIRQRYREAADIIKKGKMCCLFINDLDAGAGRMGGTTQYTVNNQMVNATLMNIADNPTNVQLPGMYNKQENARVPIIVTGNDFSTLYAPLIRDGRMEKFYWAPTREDRIGVCIGIFKTDNIANEDIVKLVDTFPGQSIDFFGALRARVYDDEVRKWISEIGVEKIGKRLVNSIEGAPKFEQPKMTLEKLLEYGNMLVKEQDNVNDDAAAADSNLLSTQVPLALSQDHTFTFSLLRPLQSQSPISICSGQFLESPMDTSEEGYKPSVDFEEESKDALVDIPDNDSTELWLIQWPMKQLDPADFHGKELKLKLHHDGQLGSIESSSGKSYDMVSYAAQEPDATVFVPSASGSKVVGKISRRVCLVRYPDPEELEKPSFYNPSLSAMKSGGSTKKSSHRGTLTSTHSGGHRSLEFSSPSTKKRSKGNTRHTEASDRSNERSHTSGGGSLVTDRSLGSEQSHGGKSKKKKKMKAEE